MSPACRLAPIRTAISKNKDRLRPILAKLFEIVYGIRSTFRELDTKGNRK